MIYATSSFRRVIVIGILVAMVTSANHSCKKQPPKPDCGCETDLTSPMPQGDTFIGKLSFTDTSVQVEAEYRNKFGITYTTSSCVNCFAHYFICNDDVVATRFAYLKNAPQQSVRVRVTGVARPVCYKPIGPADIHYYHFEIKNIEVI